MTAESAEATLGEKQITVVVADSQYLFAESLGGMLGWFIDLTIHPDHPTSAQEAMDLVKAAKPDVLLLDYWMSDMEAPAVIRRITHERGHCKVLVLSWFHGSQEIQKALDAGAVGFLPKSLRVAQVAQAIRLAHTGQYPVFADQLKELVTKLVRRSAEGDEEARRLASLTNREIYVLKMLSTGQPLEEVARELAISRSTLKNHIKSILKKTEARSHSEAVAMALRCGWIQM